MVEKNNLDIETFKINLYKNNYNRIWNTGLQKLGGSILPRLLFKFVKPLPSGRLLEIGAGSGESLQFIPKNLLICREYVALDLQPGLSNKNLKRQIDRLQGVNFTKLKFIQGDASKLPFPDNHFDIAISTCVLAHVSYPELVFSELRRVVKNKGQVVIGMPCDPGFVNRSIKNLLTYRKIRRQGLDNPRLIYALEHRNPIGNLITIAKYIYKNDTLKITFFPFKIYSWNLNLITFLKVQIVK